MAKPCVAGTTKVTLAYFTFEASQPSYSAPSNTWYTNLVAESGPGTGTASALHQGACDYSCPTGNRSDHSFGANSWNVGDFWQFACSSLGASGITVSFDLVGSATGPAEYELEYSTDGSLFINSGTIIAAALNGELPGMKPFWSSVAYHGSTHYTVDLSSVAALNNARTIWFRLVDISPNCIAGGAVGPFGTGRVDNFMVFGTESTSGRTPPVTWPKFATITYGTPLGDNQLNATSSVSGTFTYVPPSGTVLNSGTSTLTAIFNSSDTNYDSTMDTMPLSVSQAPLTVSAYNTARTFGTTNPIFTGTIFGIVNGDNITATYDSSATVTSGAGDYSIVPTLVDPNLRLTNYIVTINDGTLTVSTGAVEEVVLAQWNFTNTNLPSAALLGGTWYTNIAAVLGSGTAAGWHQHPSLYSSLTDGTNFAFSSSNWNLGDFWQFSTSFKTARGISVAWDQFSSGSGPSVYGVASSSDGIAFSPPVNVFISATDSVCSTSATDSPPALIIAAQSRTRHVVNMSSLPATGGTNLWIRLVDASTTGASGGWAGPVGINVLYSFTVYGAVPLPPGTPVISWNPQPINYGTPLGPEQLNATASTYGTFSYDPGAGTILPAGTNLLSAVFTPSDPTYFTVSNTVSLVVSYASNPTLIQPTLLSPGVFQFTISNVVPGASYAVLSTTNLLEPVTNWTMIGSASFLSPGLYQFTDTNAAAGQNFYIIRSP